VAFFCSSLISRISRFFHFTFCEAHFSLASPKVSRKAKSGRSKSPKVKLASREKRDQTRPSNGDSLREDVIRPPMGITFEKRWHRFLLFTIHPSDRRLQLLARSDTFSQGKYHRFLFYHGPPPFIKLSKPAPLKQPFLHVLMGHGTLRSGTKGAKTERLFFGDHL
jgi:hypothetical protein